MRVNSIMQRVLGMGTIVVATMVCGDRANAQARVTSGGVVCDGSTFSFSELSASISGANETRFLRVRELDAYAEKAKGLCAKRKMRGCSAVLQLQNERTEKPWPTAPDGNYIAKRALLLRNDDLFIAEATRVLATAECISELAVSPKMSSECIALAAAELKKASPLDEDFKDVKARHFFTDDCNPPSTAITVEVAQAALAVSFVAPSPPRLPPQAPGKTTHTELSSLAQNFVNCHNAMYYVTPTREITRHTSGVVDGEISVCVDTAGFAVDQPLQVTLTTPIAQTVHLLWPGEPQTLPLATAAAGGAQLVHMTIAGYPRREVLRALARHPNGPLAKIDAAEFVLKATQSQEAAAQAKGLQADAMALADIAKKVKEAEKIAFAQRALSNLVDRPAASAATTEQIVAAIQAVVDAIKALLETDAFAPTPVGVKKTAQELFPKLLKLTPTVEAARNVAKDVMAYTTRLEAKSKELETKADEALKGQVAIATAADQLCDMRSILVPLVTEDILTLQRTDGRIKSAKRAPYVIEYDFGGGFQGAPSRPIMDEDEVFVEVHNVQPGWSVGVAVGNRTVVHRDTGLIGAGKEGQAFDIDQKTGQSRPAFHALRPFDLEMQPPTTQIVALGHLPGGARYDLSVCATTSGADDCSTPTTPTKAGPIAPATDTTIAHRLIAKNSVVVHSKHYLGVRAGFGVSGTFGELREAVAVPGASTSVVQGRQVTANASLPLLLTVYPWGRDGTELPHEWHVGGAFGLDVLKATTNPRFLAGLVVDRWGLGLTVAYSLENVSTQVAPTGTVFAPGVSGRSDDVWRSGVFLGLTTDLDVFEAVFQKYFNASSLPNVAPPSESAK